MHKSRFAGFIIDCHTDDLDAAAGFWSARARPRGRVGRERPRGRCTARSTPRPTSRTSRCSSVEHASRVHLDIESDDVEAEVCRLERLGARRVGAVSTWVVMEAPTGQRFCVVRVQRADFAAKANTWTE